MLPAGKFWMDSRSTSLIKSREHGDNGRGGGGCWEGLWLQYLGIGSTTMRCTMQCDARIMQRSNACNNATK
jgi:hypothetical protein